MSFAKALIEAVLDPLLSLSAVLGLFLALSVVVGSAFQAASHLLVAETSWTAFKTGFGLLEHDPRKKPEIVAYGEDDKVPNAGVAGRVVLLWLLWRREDGVGMDDCCPSAWSISRQ